MSGAMGPVTRSVDTSSADAGTHIADTTTAHAAASVDAVKRFDGGMEVIDLHGSAAVGALETISLANGNVHRLILDENLTITLSGTTASVACSVTVILVQDAGAGNTVTWPVSVKWPGGVAPVITATANAVDIITLLTADNGTTWYGFRAGAGMA